MQREGGLVVDAPAPARTTASKLADTVTVWSVFKPPVPGRTLMGILVNVVVGFCLYGFINRLPTFLVKPGVSIASSLVWVTMMALGAPAGAIIGLLLVDRIGRKPIIIGASLWAATFGVAFAYVGSSGTGFTLMAMGCYLFLGIYVILAIGFALHVPELFRTE